MANACSKCSIDQILFDYGVWALIAATADIVNECSKGRFNFACRSLILCSVNEQKQSGGCGFTPLVSLIQFKPRHSTSCKQSGTLHNTSFTYPVNLNGHHKSSFT